MTDKLRELIYGRIATCNHGDTWARRIGELAGTGLSFTPAGGGGWTKFVRGALDAAETVGELIEVSKSALRLALGEGDLDDLVTLGIGAAGLGAGGLPPGKGNSNLGDLDVHPSTPVGRKGKPIMVPEPANQATKIGNRTFTGHALNRMQKQGITPSVVENTIQNGQNVKGKKPGTTAHFDFDNGLTVITDTSTGNIITVDLGIIQQ